jgi:hypothetical protein
VTQNGVDIQVGVELLDVLNILGNESVWGSHCECLRRRRMRVVSTGTE